MQFARQENLATRPNYTASHIAFSKHVI